MTPLAHFCFFTPHLDALGLSSLQCELLFLSHLASTLPSFSIYLVVSSSEIYALGQSDFQLMYSGVKIFIVAKRPRSECVLLCLV